MGGSSHLVSKAFLLPASTMSFDSTPSTPTSSSSTDSVGAVLSDVETRMRVVEQIQKRLPNNAFCNLELLPLLQSRKKPLEQVGQQCVALSDYAARHRLW